MVGFEKLKKKGSEYFVTKRKKFKPSSVFKKETVEKVFNFSYEMSFGKKGEHRPWRSGGREKRSEEKIFANCFLGKLGEFGACNEFYKNGIKTPQPNLDAYKLGEWDNFDLNIKGKKIAVKTTKSFGNLLLLEAKDWNEKGDYIPNLKEGTSKFDFIIFCRVSPDPEKILKGKVFFSAEGECRKFVEELFLLKKWSADVVGYISLKDLIFIIKNNFLIPQKSLLNRRTRMDASNYYVQAFDMRPFEKLCKEYFLD